MAGHYAQAAVCPLLQLTDDELELVGYTICDALRPGIAGSLAAACRHIWQVMRRCGRRWPSFSHGTRLRGKAIRFTPNY